MQRDAYPLSVWSVCSAAAECVISNLHLDGNERAAAVSKNLIVAGGVVLERTVAQCALLPSSQSFRSERWIAPHGHARVIPGHARVNPGHLHSQFLLVQKILFRNRGTHVRIIGTSASQIQHSVCAACPAQHCGILGVGDSGTPSGSCTGSTGETV